MNLKTLFLSTLTFLALISCSTDSNDDVTDPTTNPTNNSIARSIAEYPGSGTLLSSLSSNLDGDVSFSLLEESVSGAFALTSAGLTVADWQVYDFETRTQITGTILATNGTETQDISVTIDIDNVDDIWAFLNDSRSAYENATPGQWVPISESEYNDLANYLADTFKSGATDSDLYSTTSISSSAGNITLSNVNDRKLPQGSYLFAFKYYSWVNNSNGVQVKLSEGNFSGNFYDVGEALPEHNDEFNQFVLKGASSPVEDEGYLGMFAPNNYGSKEKSGAQFLYGIGNTSFLPESGANYVALHQGLSTTLKQWD